MGKTIDRPAPNGEQAGTPSNWDPERNTFRPDRDRQDAERNRLGAPAGSWMDGASTGGPRIELMVAASASPQFDRTLAPKGPEGKDASNTWTTSYLNPETYAPGLPKLDDAPSRRIYRDPPITTLDEFGMEDIRTALGAHVLGQFLSSSRLADVMTGDDRVASVLGTRVKGMLGLPLSVRTPRRSKGNKVARRASRSVRRLWSRMVPRPQVAEFLQWAVMMGFALAEVVWRERKGMWVPTIRTWHPQLTYYRYDERAYYVITMDGPVKVTPGDGKWILYAPHGEYRGWMHGVVRTCSSPWRFRTYGMRDWARHAEKHGMPWVLPKVPRNSNDQEKSRFFSALNNLGSEPTIICPVVDKDNQFDVELKEAAHPAADVFEKLIMRCDTLISCAILGQNLTTEVQGGSYAAATVHGQVRQDFLESDARTLAECLRTQLLRPFVQYNFDAGAEALPEVEWDSSPPSDKKLTADVVKGFADAVFRLAQAGFPIDVGAFAEQFGVPVDPSGKSHLLKPPANPFNSQGASVLNSSDDVLRAVQDMREQLSSLMVQLKMA